MYLTTSSLGTCDVLIYTCHDRARLTSNCRYDDWKRFLVFSLVAAVGWTGIIKFPLAKAIHSQLEDKITCYLILVYSVPSQAS